MHILLTDVVSCPRCGPSFGLIVLADRLERRRVMEGSLGCANCREEYPIRGGVADLRYPPGSTPEPVTAGPEGDDAAFRLAALLGVADRAGTVLLLGVPAPMVGEVGALLPNAQVAAEAPADQAEISGGEVSWMRIAGGLPFRDRSLWGVVLSGGSVALLDDAVRVLAPGARVVLDPAPAGAAERLRERGAEVLLEQDGVVVALAPAAR